MGYDETAHREHIKWCCQQLDAIKAIDGLPYGAAKALADSIDHLNQTFADRSRLEGALSRHLEKTMRAEEALQDALKKFGEAKDVIRNIEKENLENKSKIRRLESGASSLAARHAIEWASNNGMWMNKKLLIQYTYNNCVTVGLNWYNEDIPYELAEFAANKELKRSDQFERHPKNGMFRKRRNPKRGA